MEFSQIFDEFLTKNSISNYKMAQDTGLSDSLIGYWRKGKRKPTLDNIIAISNYLEISIGYLLTGKDEKSPQSDLTESEREILKLVQPLSDVDKIKVLGVIENYLGSRASAFSNVQPMYITEEQADKLFKESAKKTL